jgi:hypothetical protein
LQPTPLKRKLGDKWARRIAVNTLRSVVRRGYTVAQAGYFTVTSPNRWFSASQFPNRFPEFSRSRKSASPENRAATFAPSAWAGPKTADNREITLPLQVAIPGAIDRGRIRFIMILLAAALLTAAVLWWIIETGSTRLAG